MEKIPYFVDTHELSGGSKTFLLHWVIHSVRYVLEKLQSFDPWDFFHAASASHRALIAYFGGRVLSLSAFPI